MHKIVKTVLSLTFIYTAAIQESSTEFLAAAYAHCRKIFVCVLDSSVIFTSKLKNLIWSTAAATKLVKKKKSCSHLLEENREEMRMHCVTSTMAFRMREPVLEE